MSLFPRISRTAAVLTATFGLFAAPALPLLPGIPEMIPSAAASGTTVTESVVVGNGVGDNVTINANDVLKVTFSDNGQGFTTDCDFDRVSILIDGLTVAPNTPSAGTRLCGSGSNTPGTEYTFTPTEAGNFTWIFETGDPQDPATTTSRFSVEVLPVISSITPASGPLAGGGTVTVSGFGFTSAAVPASTPIYSWATSLKLGTNVVPLTLTSATSGTAVIPAGSVSGGVAATVVAELFDGVDPNPLLSNESTSSATYTYLPAPPAPNPPAPAPAPGPVVPSEVSVPVPAPVAPPAVSVLAPVVPGSNPNIPAAGVPLGGSVFLVNGEPAVVRVQPDAPSAARATGLEVQGPGFTVRLVGRTANDRPLGLTPDGALILEQDRTAFTEGTGFQPNSEVSLYVFSEARFLGTVNTDTNGSFRGSVPLPLDIPAGRHTLQSNGLAPDGAVRSLSLGVQVEELQAPTQAKKRSAKATVLFNALSAKLTPAAKRELRAVVRGRAGLTTRTLVVGYVQANDTTANDKSLSTQRAKAVARYLRSIGVKGAFITRGQGVAKERGAAARKAVVTLTYRK